MKKRVKLAIVGRPNVGKSALFNRICQKRIAIVDDVAGVTRDRLYAEADFFGHPFEVIDTAGIRFDHELPFYEEVRRQTEIAMEEADTLVMVVDGDAGVTPLDIEIARLLMRTGKPVCIGVNKVDDFNKRDDFLNPFYALGIQKLVPISALHGFNVAELLEIAFEKTVFEEEEEEELAKGIKIAIVGRPNVGKSTLMNFLLQEDRCVVSPVAGTTRDSIDVHIQVDGVDFTLIDTAGIRRKHAEHESVDKFAAIRTERAIERADICILMLDAQEGLTVQEKRIASLIEEQGKGCILIFNKWDLVKGFRMEHCLQSLREEAPFLGYCPTFFASAMTGRNLGKLFKKVSEVHEQLNRRITTGQLNKFIEQVQQKYHPPMLQGKRLRIYYLAQVDIHPPRFVLFVNYSKLMVDSYQKYMVNQFREEYGFLGAPLYFNLKEKKRTERPEAKPKPKAAPHVAETFEEETDGEKEEFDDLPDLQTELDPSYF